MAPSCTQSFHASSRLSRASSGASTPPPPPALAKKDTHDTLFKCELLSFSDNDLGQSPSSSPLLSLQLQAQQLCREDDACARFQDQETPPPFALDHELEAPISDEDNERLAPLLCDEEMQALLFCDEEIEGLNAAPTPQQPSLQFLRARSDDHQAGKKRASSSPPWPSCIADDDEWEEAGRPPPLAFHIPPTPKKARTQTKRRARSEYGPPPLPPRPINKARHQTKSRRSHEEAAAARAVRARLEHRLKTFVTRILTRQFRAPELSRGRTVLRCQCPVLALAGDEREPHGGLGCCALHQDALPEDRAWMFSAQGHAPPLVGGPGKVLVPASSKGSSKAMVLQYVRWRRSVSLPTRFYVQHVVEKQGARSAAA